MTQQVMTQRPQARGLGEYLGLAGWLLWGRGTALWGCRCPRLHDRAALTRILAHGCMCAWKPLSCKKMAEACWMLLAFDRPVFCRPSYVNLAH